MALLECHECGKRISSEAKRCPQCGAPNKHRKKPRVIRWILLSLLAALIGGYALLEAATSPNFCEGYLGRHTFTGVFDRSIRAQREHLRVVEVISQKEIVPGGTHPAKMVCEFEFRTNDSKILTYVMRFAVTEQEGGYLVRIKEK